MYVEGGGAFALDAGVLVTAVLDIVDNEVRTAVLDTSATAHMPDVLEMPYRPRIEGAAAVGEKPHPYRLGGLTCLAGDVIGDYAFFGDSANDEPMFGAFPLSIGVANVADFLDRMDAHPKWVTAGEGGHGFAQGVDQLLAGLGHSGA